MFFRRYLRRDDTYAVHGSELQPERISISSQRLAHEYRHIYGHTPAAATGAFHRSQRACCHRRPASCLPRSSSIPVREPSGSRESHNRAALRSRHVRKTHLFHVPSVVITRGGNNNFSVISL